MLKSTFILFKFKSKDKLFEIIVEKCLGDKVVLKRVVT